MCGNIDVARVLSSGSPEQVRADVLEQLAVGSPDPVIRYLAVRKVNNPGLLGFIDGDDMWDYIDRAGGLTDSADYIILYHPNGNAERFSAGCFGGDTEVFDGSTIVVTKSPIPPPEKDGETIGQIIRDLFAIAASALTIMVLAKQL